MRILYVSQYFPPEPGAPAARVSELCREWAAAGHDVTVLTGMPNHPTGVVPREYRSRLRLRELKDGVEVVRTWLYPAANRGRVRRSAAYASFAFSACAFGHWRIARPDVLVATSPQFLCAVAGRAISALRRVPFVFEVRDLWPESVVAVGALPARHPVVLGLEVVEAQLYRDAAGIVVVTDTFKRRLVDRGVSPEKIAVVKNGADLTRFQPQARETQLRDELGYGDRFVVTYAGTHGMAHGLGSVLDVAQQLRGHDEIRFLFVGEGAERDALEARARRDQLTNVTFLGALARERMGEVYATSDLCLVPLRKTELFTTVIPSKIFEIMAMERPILLSVDGEARAVVEAAQAGIFVPPEDVAGMRTRILELAGAPEQRRQMGAAGRAFVISNFDRNVLARRYLEYLENLVRRRGT